MTRHFSTHSFLGRCARYLKQFFTIPSPPPDATPTVRVTYLIAHYAGKKVSEIGLGDDVFHDLHVDAEDFDFDIITELSEAYALSPDDPRWSTIRTVEDIVRVCTVPTESQRSSKRSMAGEAQIVDANADNAT